MKYVITSMDGNGARSRGWDRDHSCMSEGNVNNENEALYIACLLRMGNGDIDLDGEYNSDDIINLEKQYLDEWYGEDENDEDRIEAQNHLNEIKKDPLTWLNSTNLDGIDGGDCWITKVKVGGKILFREDENWD